MTDAKYLWYQKVRKENICGIRTVSPCFSLADFTHIRAALKKSRGNPDPVNEETSLWLLQAMQNHIPYIYFIFLNLERKYKSSNFRLSFNFLFFLKLLPSLLFKQLGIKDEKSEQGLYYWWLLFELSQQPLRLQVAGSLTCNSESSHYIKCG